MSDKDGIDTLIKKYETKTRRLIDHISSVSYEDALENINIVLSVNCKEWEEEKKYLEEESFNKLNDEVSILSTLPATRYYFTIDKDQANGKHLHEGHIDFRPTGTISDAFLPIPKKDRFFVTCKKPYKSDDPFNPIILTVPYTTPEAKLKLSLCSPSTLWIVLATLCNELGKEYVSLREINNNLQPRSIGGAVGLREYTNLFEKYHFTTHYYLGAKKKKYYEYLEKKRCEWKKALDPIDPINFELINDLYNYYIESEVDQNFTPMNSKILYAYVESEIPVYLVFDADSLAEELGYKDTPVDYYHSVVAIGHTLDEKNNLLNFIIHDVNHSPFVEISEKFVNENLYEAAVLLPKEVKIKYEYFLQNSEKSDFAMYSKMFEKIIFTALGAFIDEKISVNYSLKIRPLLMRSQRIKFWFTNKTLYPPAVCDMYSKADFPPYVWFFEIWNLDLEGSRKCIGHIVFDATITKSSIGLVLINFPKLRVWSQNNEKINVPSETPTFDYLYPFKQFYNSSER